MKKKNPTKKSLKKFFLKKILQTNFPEKKVLPKKKLVFTNNLHDYI